MSLSAAIKQEFRKAAMVNPSLQEIRPVIKIETETFRQIFSPAKTFLQNDPIYAQNGASLADQIQEIRKMCQEAYAAHTTDNENVKKERNDALNVLQSLLDTIREMEDA